MKEFSLYLHTMHLSHQVRPNSEALVTLILFLYMLSQAAGKYRQQGRNYSVEDGDIIFFKFNAGAGLTAKKK